MDIFSLCFYTFQYSHSFPNLFPIKGKVTAEKCFLYIEKKNSFFHSCTHPGSSSTMVFRIFSTPIPVFAEIYSQTVKDQITLFMDLKTVFQLR